MHRIKLKQMGRGSSVANRIVDVHEIDTGPPPQGPEHQPTNPTEAVDANAHREPGRQSPARRWRENR
jgi:hypothetical protein